MLGQSKMNKVFLWQLQFRQRQNSVELPPPPSACMVLPLTSLTRASSLELKCNVLGASAKSIDHK